MFLFLAVIYDQIYLIYYNQRMNNKQMTYKFSKQKQELPDDNDKQNIPLRKNYSPIKDRKFAYSHAQQKQMKRYVSNDKNLLKGDNLTKDQLISILQQQLKQQREKVKYLESRTIQEQCIVLQHLETLQGKFQQLTSQKNHLEVQIRKLKSSSPQSDSSEDENWKIKYEQLQKEHKKIKKISDSLIDMMSKVEGRDGTIKQAWKWVKKIVWQYEGIKKKALQWKQVYDQVTQAVQIIEKPLKNNIN